ncbi:MAG: hypothetical protein ABIN80_14995 [Dyadobacter sp.]|uniref:hypothetical protein n=1 Tax=Dyadobacter sp. TaxID=1914288 RepID=UPI0032631F3D
MKILFLYLMSLFPISGDNPASFNLSNGVEAKGEVGRQLERYLTYPKILRDKNRAGIVVIRFYLTDGISIGRVKVFSENEELNSDLIRQLTGKKLLLKYSDPLYPHTVKLCFKRGE